jgi:hypothetical protein
MPLWFRGCAEAPLLLVPFPQAGSGREEAEDLLWVHCDLREARLSGWCDEWRATRWLSVDLLGFFVKVPHAR